MGGEGVGTSPGTSPSSSPASSGSPGAGSAGWATLSMFSFNKFIFLISSSL